MSDALYRNAAGQEVTHASYSARLDFKKCPRYFELTRVQGWRDKTERAAPLFGKCIEAGVQSFEEHAREPGRAELTFRRLWEDVKALPNFEKLEFTATEGNWDQLLRAGKEMMQLYEVVAPTLPIVGPLFQQTVKKQLFPGSARLAELQNKAIFDILSFPQWNHPLMPKIAQPHIVMRCTSHTGNPEDCNIVADAPSSRPLIIDIKTSGVNLDTALVMLDPQLAEYAWMARIPDVAFLWFVKHGHSIKEGSKVTLLRDTGGILAGTELYVVVDDSKEKGQVCLGNLSSVSLYEGAVKGLRGSAREAKKQEFREAQSVVQCTPSDITKQRLQFVAVRFTEEQMNDIGRDVAQATVEMNRAHEEGYYGMTGRGIRFPNNTCSFCGMRWICLGNSEQRDQNLSRKGDEWLDADDGE